MQKIVFTGPESTGKSTIAKAITLEMDYPLVLEYAREYLTSRQGEYNYDDLVEIAKGQIISEQQVQSETKICDTDLLTIFIWSDVKFGKCDPWIKSALIQAPALHYFLCAPEGIPWQYDPLREHPSNRKELFDMYRITIEHLQIDYTILTGDEESRLRTVRQKLSQIL